MAFSQQHRMIRIATPLCEDLFIALSFRGVEGISRDVNFALMLASEKNDITFDQFAGKNVMWALLPRMEKNVFSMVSSWNSFPWRLPPKAAPVVGWALPTTIGATIKTTSSVPDTNPAQAAAKWRITWWAMPTLPGYAKVYAKAYEAAKNKGVDIKDSIEIDAFSNHCFSDQDASDLFKARVEIQTRLGANEYFTGNGITAYTGKECSNAYGVVETFTYDKNPQTIGKMLADGRMKMLDTHPLQ